MISKNNKVVFDFAVVDEAQDDIASPTSGSLPPLVEVGLTLSFSPATLGSVPKAGSITFIL